MASPHPQPTELKRRRGNPGKRPLNTREPTPLVGLPSYPDYLPEEGRTLWEQLGSALVRNKIMTELDGAALADLVETELLNRRITEGLKAAAPVLIVDVPSDEGGAKVDAKKNPLWTLKLEYLRERRAQHQQFGLTPSSRAKLVMLPGGEDDEIEAALN